MPGIMQGLLAWFWSLIGSIQNLVNWLFTPLEILGLNVAPIFLIGGTALTIGIIRAIVGIV